MASIKCPICKKKLNKKSEYCMYCGCNIKEEYTESILNNTVEYEKKQQIKANSKIKNRKIIYISLFLIITIFIILFLSINPIKYNQAIKYMDQNNYNDAIKLLEELDNYKDSKNRLKEAKYYQLINQIDECLHNKSSSDIYDIETLEEQEAELKKFGDYKDSLEYLKDIQYNIADLYFKNGDYENAKKYYDLIKDVFEVSDKLEYIDILSPIQGSWIQEKYKFMGIKIKGTKVIICWIGSGKITSSHEFDIQLNQLSKSNPNIIKIQLNDSYDSPYKLELKNNSKLIWYSYDTKFEFVKGSFTDEYIKEPQIGMTADEVLESTWGAPKKRNKTTYSWGVKEQWVYSGNRYIYLEDGIVTSISE